MSYSFPEAHVVAKLLSDLVGSPVVLEAAEDRAALDRLPRPFACICIDDAGAPVGAMVADLTASISLGGQLMMLPEDGLVEQHRQKTPSEDVVAAVSEIFNNLTTTLNQVPGNPHIRSTPAKLASQVVATPNGSWIPKATTRADLTGDLLCGKGRVILMWK